VADGWVPGKTLFTVEEAAERGTVIQYLLSDAGQRSQWPKIVECLNEGDMLYFSHGFSITYKDQTGVVPPPHVDVALVAPKGSGRSVRTNFLDGSGINASFAVHQDATGRATERTLALGIAIGAGYLFPTTFQNEVYSDLTGERGVLIGALSGVMEAQYNELRKHGHTPSEAFNETVEELTQSLIRLVGENGMDFMYANCSTTAQRGALDWKDKFRDAVAPVFDDLYRSVVDGEETRIVLEKNSDPKYREKLDAELKVIHDSEMWRAGAAVRSLRPENWKK
jgi:ketol-acid reductoisomerase